jgi:6-pyruvoyltetrahydropterin/6-carboxytetrahydropterin synthase
MYRVCKAFEVESGHMLFKHPGRCRFPHGHTRRIEIVVASPTLDDADMVCDFKALKLAVASAMDRLDHSMALNSQDPAVQALTESDRGSGARLVIFEDQDPTTEVLAKHIYEVVQNAVGKRFRSHDGHEYALSASLIVERVRVSETSTSWAEYGR